jgi:DNA recombination protein RmuC
VRKHIKDIHQKYIKPEEDTMDFAFMYVPADSVFFEIIVNNPELSQQAQENRVFIVSPSMFYSSLQVILLSFQSQKFEAHAKKVLSLIQGVKKESLKFGENLAVLNRHVSNAKNKMDEVSSGYASLDGKINQVDGSEGISGGGSSEDRIDSEYQKSLSRGGEGIF